MKLKKMIVSAALLLTMTTTGLTAHSQYVITGEQLKEIRYLKTQSNADSLRIVSLNKISDLLRSELTLEREEEAIINDIHKKEIKVYKTKIRNRNIIIISVSLLDMYLANLLLQK